MGKADDGAWGSIKGRVEKDRPRYGRWRRIDARGIPDNLVFKDGKQFFV